LARPIPNATIDTTLTPPSVQHSVTVDNPEQYNRLR
jgi:hypothetical protein